MNHTIRPESAWIERDLQPRFPQLADRARQAYRVLDGALVSGELPPADLALLEAACASQSSMLADCAACVLAELAGPISAAGERLLALATSGRAGAAIAALAAMRSVQSITLREQLVRCGVAHRSRKVRDLAISKALEFRLRSMLGELEQRLTVETDAGCRNSLRFSIDLLRDGYRLEPDAAGAVYITVVGRASITGQSYSREEVADQGIERLIQELRASAI